MHPAQVRRWAAQLSWTPPESARAVPPPPPARSGASRIGRESAARLRPRVRPRLRAPVPAARRGRAARRAARRASRHPRPGRRGVRRPARSRPTRSGSSARAPLPLLEALQAALPPAERAAGCSCAAPTTRCRARSTERRHLGFVEAFPNNPRRARTWTAASGCGRCCARVDLRARRHRDGARRAAGGRAVAASWARCTTSRRTARSPCGSRTTGSSRRPPPGGRPTGAASRSPAGPPRRSAGAARPREPLRPARPGGRAPAVRRPRRPRAGAAAPDGPPAGYLWPDAGDGGRRALYAAVHPVTGDQLLTRGRLEAADMGYGEAVLLGWVVRHAPVTGSLAPRPVDVPWAVPLRAHGQAASHDRRAHDTRHGAHRRRHGVRARGRRAAARRRAPGARARRPGHRASASPTTCPRRSSDERRERAARPRRRAAALAAGPVLPRRRPRDRRRVAQRPRWVGFGQEVPQDLSGMRVLDVGSNAGYDPFMFAKRGADRDPRLRAVRVHRPGALPGGDLPHRRRLPAVEVGGPRSRGPRHLRPRPLPRRPLPRAPSDGDARAAALDARPRRHAASSAR